MVYIKHSVSAYRRKQLEPVDIEAVCIDVKGRGNNWFSLLACYRSPNKNKPTEFLPSLYSTTENLYNHRNELLIIGDLRTFAPIVSAHPYCARKCTRHVIHERAR